MLAAGRARDEAQQLAVALELLKVEFGLAAVGQEGVRQADDGFDVQREALAVRVAPRTDQRAEHAVLVLRPSQVRVEDLRESVTALECRMDARKREQRATPSRAPAERPCQLAPG